MAHNDHHHLDFWACDFLHTSARMGNTAFMEYNAQNIPVNIVSGHVSWDMVRVVFAPKYSNMFHLCVLPECWQKLKGEKKRKVKYYSTLKTNRFISV